MKECYIFKANISERYLLLNFDILKCYKVKKRFSALKLKSKRELGSINLYNKKDSTQEEH